jgi:hypothetical protein
MQASSWAKFAPAVKKSADNKKGKSRPDHGNRYLAKVLGEAAVAAGRTDTFLGQTLPTHRPPPQQEQGHRRPRPRHPS